MVRPITATLTALAFAVPGGCSGHGDRHVSNAFTQENLEILEKHDITILGPMKDIGFRMSGKGRSWKRAFCWVLAVLLQPRKPFGRKKVIVTAGGTQEPLDPVRVLTNHSSGKQGYALAQAALDAGADVTLISAPTSMTPPEGVKTISIQTAEEMHTAMLKEIKQTDAVIMAAAVADFRPTSKKAEKIKKEGKLSETSWSDHRYSQGIGRMETQP